MTTLTIVKEDSAVTVDGVGRGGIDCTSLAANVHAVQFDGTNGHIEYTDGTANEAIDSISAYQSIIDLHTAAAPPSDAEAFAALTPIQKRAQSYASIGDQLDQQYHDAVDGTTTWKDAITAVKSAYPK
jgi:hypothetical protein